MFNNMKLLFTDTDSLCVSVNSTDVYLTMCQKEHLENANLFDFSEYPRPSVL